MLLFHAKEPRSDMAFKGRAPIKYTSVQSVTSVGYNGWVPKYYNLPQTVGTAATILSIGKGVDRYPQKSGPVHAPDHGLSPTGSMDS